MSLYNYNYNYCKIYRTTTCPDTCHVTPTELGQCSFTFLTYNLTLTFLNSVPNMSAFPLVKFAKYIGIIIHIHMHIYMHYV